jgi:hypothetical protein
MRHSAVFVFFTFAAAASLVATCVATRRDASRLGPVPSRALDEPRAARAATSDLPAAREPVAPASRPVSQPEFGPLFARLVALGEQQRDLATHGELDAARALDARVSALIGEIFTAIPGADGKALQRWLAQRSVAAGARPEVEGLACELLVAAGLARRGKLLELGDDRKELDALVAWILAELPDDEAQAPSLAHLLTGKPFLGTAHEQPVQALVSGARERPWLARIATDLLLTLWKNLEAQGLRRPEEIAALALVQKDSGDASARLAALEMLLTAAGGRYRSLVEQEVLERRDATLARALANAAAIVLAPRDALDLLLRLAPLAPGSMTGPFLNLGHRDSKALREAYVQMLADNVQPRLRAELVSGAGFQGGDNLETAQIAFEHDADPEVRSRALCVLTAKAGAALGEKTLMAALDDPGYSSDPARLGTLVLALENLAGGDPNVLDRVARRIGARSELLPSDRRRLEALLARALPRRAKYAAGRAYFFFSVCSVCLRRRGQNFFSESFSVPGFLRIT